MALCGVGLEGLKLAAQDKDLGWMRKFIKINPSIAKAGGEGSLHHHVPPCEACRMLAAPCATPISLRTDTDNLRSREMGEG